MDTDLHSESGAGDRIRVFLVDDHAVVRAGLRSILSRESDMIVVGDAPDAETALGLLESLGPTVVVLDYRLPGMSGIDLCREIAERRLRSEVVILSAFLEKNLAEAALQAGARAYVVKDVEAAELKIAIRSAARGKTTIDPKVQGGFDPNGDRKRIPPRYLPVLNALAQGMSSVEIGDLLSLSRSTVRSYTRDLYAKLGVNSLTEALAAAARRGLL